MGKKYRTLHDAAAISTSRTIDQAPSWASSITRCLLCSAREARSKRDARSSDFSQRLPLSLPPPIVVEWSRIDVRATPVLLESIQCGVGPCRDNNSAGYVYHLALVAFLVFRLPVFPPPGCVRKEPNGLGLSGIVSHPEELLADAGSFWPMILTFKLQLSEREQERVTTSRLPAPIVDLCCREQNVPQATKDCLE